MSKNFVPIETFIHSKNIKFNEINKTLYINKEPLNENEIYREIINSGLSVTKTDLTTILYSDIIKRFNPIKEYFNEIDQPCDNDYIGLLCKHITLNDDSENKLFETMFKKHLVRCIAAVMGTGINKHCFILQSERQNTGKTHFIRWLVPKDLSDYYMEDITMDKDGLAALCNSFIVNIDELTTIDNIDINRLKSLLSKDTVKIRLPYDKHHTQLKRISSFFGSTNKPEFINDESGSVRWICFKIKYIDWNYPKNINVNNVWNQALQLYKNGYNSSLNNEDININEERNNNIYISTNELELINKDFRQGSEFYTATEIQIYLQNKYSVNLNIIAIGRALNKLGYDKKSIRSDGIIKKGYLLYIN